VTLLSNFLPVSVSRFFFASYQYSNPSYLDASLGKSKKNVSCFITLANFVKGSFSNVQTEYVRHLKNCRIEFTVTMHCDRIWPGKELITFKVKLNYLEMEEDYVDG